MRRYQDERFDKLYTEIESMAHDSTPMRLMEHEKLTLESSVILVAVSLLRSRSPVLDRELTTFTHAPRKLREWAMQDAVRLGILIQDERARGKNKVIGWKEGPRAKEFWFSPKKDEE